MAAEPTATMEPMDVETPAPKGKEEPKEPEPEPKAEKPAEKKKKKKSGPPKMSDVISDITKRLDDLDMNTLKKILEICKSKEGDGDW